MSQKALLQNRKHYSYSGAGSLGLRRSLLATHSARIQCDHCGMWHEAESWLSLADAHNTAQSAVRQCLESRERHEVANAHSNFNHFPVGIIGRYNVVPE